MCSRNSVRLQSVINLLSFARRLVARDVIGFLIYQRQGGMGDQHLDRRVPEIFQELLLQMSLRRHSNQVKMVRALQYLLSREKTAVPDEVPFRFLNFW